MQIPILSGIVGNATPDLFKSYPVNVVPYVESGDTSGTGISKGYLRSLAGVATKAETEGLDRGGYVWNGTHYRVIADRLVSVSPEGAQTDLGSVGPGGPVTWAESFDRLAINSGLGLFYYKDGEVTQVSDPDLGEVLSLVWSDGYFITTDGTSIVVTELANPANVDPLKYGSSEAVPDPVRGLLSLRGEIFALNRYSIEAFSNRGTTGFPFARNRGAEIGKGCIGRKAFSPFVETFAFVGSGRNEDLAVYLAGSGQAIKISPRGLDIDLATLTEAHASEIHMEQRNAGGQLELLVHLPNATWVYGWVSSQQLDQPIWYKLASGINSDGAYPARNHTLVDGQWWVGTDGKIGVIDSTISTVFDDEFFFVFDTLMLYNASEGALVHELELVTLAGRTVSTPASISLSSTIDGITYGQERATRLGPRGARNTRPSWRRLGLIRNWRGFRFRGRLTAPVAFARLEAQIEALSGGQ